MIVINVDSLLDAYMHKQLFVIFGNITYKQFSSIVRNLHIITKIGNQIRLHTDFIRITELN